MSLKWKSRLGLVLSGAPALMLLMSVGMKLGGVPGLAEGFVHLGLKPELAVPLGLLELACTVVYLIPRTAVLGAILLTGYMGGAILTHLRVGDPFVVQVLLGMALWGGLYLRDPRVAELIPLTGRRG